MGKENIEEYSAVYAVLKRPAKLWHNKFFYRKVIVIGRENLNPDDSLIFAPNHQNALMDALAVLFTAGGQPVFLARADIFRKRLIASLLYFLKILPVYRIRDGIENLKTNDLIFQKTLDVLKNRNGLVILPEGNQESVRRLRQLKKGIFRIAFHALDSTGFAMNIKIIPVGLEFSHYSRIRQVLTVVYGSPIDVREYKHQYLQNAQKAINSLKDKLSAEMHKIMVHIESQEDYEAIDELRSIINGRYSDDIKNPKLFRDRMLISKLNELKRKSADVYNKICMLSLSIKEKTSLLRLDYRLLDKKKHTFAGMSGGILLLAASLPLFLYGILFNYVFYAIPNLTLKSVSDKHFHGSVKYTISLFLAMLLIPVYLLLCLALISPWWLALAAFITIPLSGIFAWSYYLLFMRISGGIRIRKYTKSGNDDYLNLRKNFEELNSLILNLINLK